MRSTRKSVRKPKDFIEEERDLIQTTEKILKNRINALKSTNVTYSDVFNISKYSKEMSENSNNIYELFPDIDLAIEIVVSSIMAPNDMTKPVLTFKFNNSPINTRLTNIVSSKINTYMNREYNLLGKVYDIIKESMFTKGSYVELIIPSNSVLDMVKGKFRKGYESYTNNIKSRELGGLLEITDDISELINNDIRNKKEEYKKGFENVNFTSSYRNMLTEDVIALDLALDKGLKSKPIIKRLEPESVIPIADKNDPSIHYGYFILLDDQGTPVNISSYKLNPVYKSLVDNANADAVNRILSRAKRLISSKLGEPPVIKNLNELRQKLILDKISKLKLSLNTDLQDTLSLEDRQYILDILLTRLLEEKKTKLLFVPKEFIMYYAYEYRSNGTGRSKLEKIAILASIKVITMFVELLAYVKSSIPITKVEATLDEDDPEYDKTMESIIVEVMKNRQLNIPIGIMKVDDVVDWVHKVGFSFNFKHPGLPDVDIDISEETFDIDPVNSELTEKLDKLILKSFGLTPEMVENAYSPDFATTIVANNILFTRRISVYQTRYNQLFTEHVRKILKLDNFIKNDITELLRSNIREIRSYLTKTAQDPEVKDIVKRMKDDTLVEVIYKKIVDSIVVTLPEPKVTDRDNLKEMYDEFIDSLDTFLENIVDPEILPEDVVGDMSDKLDTVKKAIRTIVIEKWAIEHGYMKEVTDLFAIDKDGKPIVSLLDEYKEYTNMMESVVIPFLKQIHKTKTKIDEKIDKIENDEEEENTTEEYGNEETETTEENTEEIDEEETEETAIEEEQGMEEGTEEQPEDNVEEENEEEQ